MGTALSTPRKSGRGRLLIPLLGLVFALRTFADSIFIPLGATWKYLDDGSDQGTAWRSPAFNDSAWNSGPAELGYGDGDEQTVINGGPAGDRLITTYFRKTFNVADPAGFSFLKLRLMRDDGAVVYLNGTEIRRGNLPQ